MEIIVKQNDMEAKFFITVGDNIFTVMGQFIRAALVAGYIPEEIMNACEAVTEYDSEEITSFYWDRKTIK